MARKVKVIKDTSLIPVNVSSSSIVDTKSDEGSKGSFLAAKLDREIERSIRTDESLQEQINTIKESGFALVDVVMTYADLVNYDTHSLVENDIIVVLYDENGREVGDRSTYYRWNGSEFDSIGSSNYTIDEIDRVVSDLRQQISYLGQKSSVRDVVTNHEALANYDITNLIDGDIVVVLDDEILNHATAYYSLSNGEWVAHGSMGPNYYNRREIDAKLAEINEHLEQVDETLDNHEERIQPVDMENRCTEEEALRRLQGFQGE